MHALYFYGNEKDDPTWLVDKQGRVIVFEDKSIADDLMKTLLSDFEEIAVLHFADAGIVGINKEFEQRQILRRRFRSG